MKEIKSKAKATTDKKLKKNCKVFFADGTDFLFKDIYAINISENWIMITYDPDNDYKVFNRTLINKIEVKNV